MKIFTNKNISMYDFFKLCDKITFRTKFIKFLKEIALKEYYIKFPVTHGHDVYWLHAKFTFV